MGIKGNQCLLLIDIPARMEKLNFSVMSSAILVHLPLAILSISHNLYI